VVGFIAAALLLIGSCGAYVVVHADDIFFRGPSRSEGPSWAGFHDLHRARVTGYHSDCGRDCNVDFLLVGSASEVDGALSDAGVEDLHRPTEPLWLSFASSFPPKGFHLAPIVRPLVGKSSITNKAGTTVHRTVLRSALPDGQVQLYVEAITT